MLFSPQKGWTNDPNGLIVIDNVYHLFFQYYPDDIVWGPMHWGHAISQNGIDWEEMDVAIYPDDAGYIFSGSAILDKARVSGLGGESDVPLLCFYTQHNPESGEQQQCIAYSTDYVHFIKYEKNPVIRNTLNMPYYRKDFRDPKVFANTVLGGYSMVVAAGENLEFYHADNLLDWVYTGMISIAGYLGKGICECPDCFLLDDKWILTLSYIPMSVPDSEVKDFKDRHTMNYFVGVFDGNTFIPDAGENGTRLLDYGPDNYAAVTFSNSSDECLFMGWGENWDYVYDIPADVFRGHMTSIRKARLICVADKLHMSFELMADTKEAVILPGNSVVLKSDEGDSVEIFADEKCIRVLRKPILGTDNSKWLNIEGYNCFEANRVFDGDCVIKYRVENGYYEILADKGCICFSVCTR